MEKVRSGMRKPPHSAIDLGWSLTEREGRGGGNPIVVSFRQETSEANIERREKPYHVKTLGRSAETC
jgi:hypothetical protein